VTTTVSYTIKKEYKDGVSTCGSTFMHNLIMHSVCNSSKHST